MGPSCPVPKVQRGSPFVRRQHNERLRPGPACSNAGCRRRRACDPHSEDARGRLRVRGGGRRGRVARRVGLSGAGPPDPERRLQRPAGRYGVSLGAVVVAAARARGGGPRRRARGRAAPRSRWPRPGPRSPGRRRTDAADRPAGSHPRRARVRRAGNRRRPRGAAAGDRGRPRAAADPRRAAQDASAGTGTDRRRRELRRDLVPVRPADHRGRARDRGDGSCEEAVAAGAAPWPGGRWDRLAGHDRDGEAHRAEHRRLRSQRAAAPDRGAPDAGRLRVDDSAGDLGRDRQRRDLPVGARCSSRGSRAVCWCSRLRSG